MLGKAIFRIKCKKHLDYNIILGYIYKCELSKNIVNIIQKQGLNIYLHIREWLDIKTKYCY